MRRIGGILTRRSSTTRFSRPLLRSRVEVVEGDVSAVTSVDSEEEVDSSLLGFAHDLTVQGLFEFIEATLSEEPARAEITYDPDPGAPTDPFTS